MGAKIDLRWHPKRPKFRDDFQEQKQYSPRASWSRLGPILGHFGSQLGVRKQVFALENVIFASNSRVLKKTTVQDAFWSELGPTLTAKRVENDLQSLPQTESKSIKNRCRKLIEILIDFRSIFGHPRDHLDLFLRNRIRGSAAEAWAL